MSAELKTGSSKLAVKVYSAKEAVPPPVDRSFPMIIGHKSANVKIYAVPNRGVEAYTVAYHSNGERVRKTRRDFNKAFKFAQSVALKSGDGTGDVLTLSGRERFVYTRAVEVASELGIDLDVMAGRFREASKLADGSERIVEAVRAYRTQQSRDIEQKSVLEVVRELIQNRRANGKSELYLRDLRVRLEQRFAGAFKMSIGSVTSNDIERFLETIKGSPRTKLNFLTAIGTLFAFAKNRSYVAENHPGISRVEFDAEIVTDIEIFTIEEMRKLLASAKPMLVPILAICAFAGLRSEEGKRLLWSQVNFAERFIEVTAKNAKTKTRRIVPNNPSASSVFPERKEVSIRT